MPSLGLHHGLMAGAAAIALVASATPAMAQTRTFDVPEGPAARTILIFAKQAGAHMLGNADDLRGKRTKALKGNFTVKDGLDRLLEGTGLGETSRDGGITTIGLVQRGNGTGESTAAQSDDEAGRAEILVIGNRSRNVDVRRTENDAQPYVVFNREEIQTSQATTIEEFLRTRLPQNSSPGGSNAQSTGNGLAYSKFNLRGLGTDQTLILVNGRRLPVLANQNLSPQQADINGIPVGAIERIEVLPSSAGGIYGGNAVGGVINIILRSDYRGLDVALTYNDTFDLHAPNARLDVNGGFALEGGRTTVTFGGSLSRSGTLRVGDRLNLIKDGIDLYRRNIDITERPTPPYGNGVNIRSANGAPLVLDPQYGGTNLGSAFTTIPLGYGGVGSDNGAALVRNAGTYNLDVPSDLSGIRRGLLTSPRVASANLNIRRKFSSALDLFVDYSHLENAGLSYSANQAPNSVNLAANAPNNPFQQAVRITFPVPDASFPYRSKSVTNMLSTGAILRLPGSWALNLEYNKTWTKNRASLYQLAIPADVNACLTSGAATCNGGPGLNPFQPPIDFSPYLYRTPSFVSGPYNSQFNNPVLRASGPLFKLPGGKANFTAAVQRESTIIEDASNSISDGTADGRIYAIFPGRKQSTTSEYAEVTLPLVSPSTGIPLINELELRGAVRHDSYFTSAPPGGESYIDYPFGDMLYTQLGGYGAIYTGSPDVRIPPFNRAESRFQNTSFTAAGRYSPVAGVVLRASYATGFLPPNVVQIATTSSAGWQATPDPFRGNTAEYYPITVLYSGRSDLKPERSKTLSAGMILTPLEGLRVSADYTRIQKTGELASPPTDFVLANPDLFPGRVVREPLAAGDPEGYLGRIVSIDTSLINALRSQFQAIDFQADYSWKFEEAGSFRIYALGTWQPDTVRQLLVAAPSLNASGNSDGPLRWQGNGGLDWSKGALSVRWNTQFYSGYNVYSTQDTTLVAGQQVVDAAIEAQGARRIPHQAYSDLFVSFDFGERKGVAKGVRLSAGIQNLFNTKPPVIAISSYTQAGYSTYGDPRLRRFSLSLRKAFGTR